MSDIQLVHLSFSPGSPAALGWGRCSKQRLLGHLLRDLGAEFDADAAHLEPHRVPRLPEPWTLSLADCAGWRMAAVSSVAGVRLGVDLERRRPRETGPLETHLGWLERSDDLHHFYRRWTLAEACFKALGGAVYGPVTAAALFAGLDFATSSALRKTEGIAARIQGLSVWVQWRQPLPDFESCVVALLPSAAVSP